MEWNEWKKAQQKWDVPVDGFVEWQCKNRVVERFSFFISFCALRRYIIADMAQFFSFSRFALVLFFFIHKTSHVQLLSIHAKNVFHLCALRRNVHCFLTGHPYHAFIDFETHQKQNWIKNDERRKWYFPKVYRRKIYYIPFIFTYFFMLFSYEKTFTQKSEKMNFLFLPFIQFIEFCVIIMLKSMYLWFHFFNSKMIEQQAHENSFFLSAVTSVKSYRKRIEHFLFYFTSFFSLFCVSVCMCQLSGECMTNEHMKRHSFPILRIHRVSNRKLYKQRRRNHSVRNGNGTNNQNKCEYGIF